MSDYYFTDDDDTSSSAGAAAMEAARDAAVRKYPGAAPLRHMLTGTTPEEVEDVAKQVAEALAAQQNAAAPSSPSREERRLTAEQQAFRNRKGDTLREKLTTGGYNSVPWGAMMQVKMADAWLDTDGHLNDSQIHDLREAARLASIAGDNQAKARYEGRLRRGV